MTSTDSNSSSGVEALTLPYDSVESPAPPVIDTSAAMTSSESGGSLARRTAASIWQFTKRHGPLLAILLAQSVLTIRLANTAFQDESLYLFAGHREIALLFHHTSTYDNYASYFSGAPFLYPVLGAAVDGMFGLGGARNLSLIFMLLTTTLLFSFTRHLFGRPAAIGAAAAFGLSTPVLFMGHLATFDAPALFLLALATWIVVRFAHRTFAIALLAAPLLVLASATKYAAFLYVPTVVIVAVLAAVGVAGWLRAILRGLALAVLTGALLAAAWVASGAELRLGIHTTTLSRQVGTDTPWTVTQKAVLWGGGVMLLALVGGVLCTLRRWPSVESARTLVRTRGQRILLALVLFGTGLLAPANQIHLHVLTSLHKHIGFGLLFAAPLAGVALARMLGANSQDPKRLGLVLAICVALAWNGLVQSEWLFQSWPNATNFDQVMRTQVRPVTGRYLVEESEVPRYYLRELVQPYQWSGTYALTYTNPKGKVFTGLTAYQQAIDDKYFDIVAFRFGPTAPLDEQLLPLLQSGTNYSLIASVPFDSSFGTGTWYVYRANR